MAEKGHFRNHSRGHEGPDDPGVAPSQGAMQLLACGHPDGLCFAQAIFAFGRRPKTSAARGAGLLKMGDWEAVPPRTRGALFCFPGQQNIPCIRVFRLRQFLEELHCEGPHRFLRMLQGKLSHSGG